MNTRILHIATNTFREAVRDRVLYNLIAFALLMTGAAVLVGQISIDIEKLVVINLGLTAVSLFGTVIAIFIGIGLVSKEIEKRTLYTVLSRPVRRWEFIAGKFFGLAGTLIVNTFLMAIGVFAALLYVSRHFAVSDSSILSALYFIVLQVVIITALALFFSAFSSPKLLKRASLGYSGLLADIYWTRAVQYYGGKHQQAMRYDLLWPLLNITTQLDPHLIPAYLFGGTFLSQKPPDGAGDAAKAIELVEFGIRNNPDDWHLYYDLGYIHYD